MNTSSKSLKNFYYLQFSINHFMGQPYDCSRIVIYCASKNCNSKEIDKIGYIGERAFDLKIPENASNSFEEQLIKLGWKVIDDYPYCPTCAIVLEIINHKKDNNMTINNIESRFSKLIDQKLYITTEYIDRLTVFNAEAWCNICDHSSTFRVKAQYFSTLQTSENYLKNNAQKLRDLASKEFVKDGWRLHILNNKDQELVCTECRNYLLNDYANCIIW